MGDVRNHHAISAAGGPDTRGWTRIMESSDVRHALKSHGLGTKGWARGDRLSQGDLSKVERIVEAAQPKFYRRKEGDRLMYEASVDGRLYTYVETVSRKRQVVAFKTMWRKG